LAFSYWIAYLGFITEGKLAAIFIKPSLGISNWPFTSSTTRQQVLWHHSSPHHQQVFWRRCREKEDFCKGSFARTSFTLFKFCFYFIFTCIILSKTQKN
jgi:hypothetical protein